MSTIHINSCKNDFSDKVIISGDPKRVKYISKKYLKNVIKINEIRFILGYTGYYKNKKISVMSHGIGIPSCLLYVQELIQYYNVKKIIRIGTCGTINKKINLNDIVISMGACTNSNINRLRFNNYDFSAIADFELLYKAKKFSKRLNIDVFIGNFFTSDFFYEPNNYVYDFMRKFNILAIDMETVALYSIALEMKVKALSMCMVSDNILNNKKISINDRIICSNKLIKLALEII